MGGGAVYGLSELVGGGGPATEEPGPAAPGAPGHERPAPAPVDPASVKVAVLNGTTVEGLAAQIGDKVAEAGFQKGNVDNATEQQKAESVVLYADGARRQARAVANRLEITQIERIDPASRALAGDATVVVVVGADKTQ